MYFLRKTPSQSRSRATVDAVLGAAVQVLIEIGYRHASTNRIADRAGVSIGSVYEYFPGKEAIFAEVRRREDRRLFDLIMSHQIPETVRELLRQHVALHVELVRTNLTLYSALLSEVPHFAIVRNELPRFKLYVPWAEKYFRLHQDEIRQFSDLGKMVQFVIRVGHSTVDDYVLNDPGALTDSAVEDQVVDMLGRYILIQP